MNQTKTRSAFNPQYIIFFSLVHLEEAYFIFGFLKSIYFKHQQTN